MLVGLGGVTGASPQPHLFFAGKLEEWEGVRGWGLLEQRKIVMERGGWREKMVLGGFFMIVANPIVLGGNS